MTEQPSQFTYVRRGYDPDEVEQRLADFARAVTELAAQRDQLAVQLDAASAAALSMPVLLPPTGPATFEHLGDRVGQILGLARDEADELRARSTAEISRSRVEHENFLAATRAEIEAYVAGARHDSDLETQRLLADARRQASDLVEAAQRDADARINEAQAVYEDQKASAAKAAADFETTLNERRLQHEAEFSASISEANARLDHANQLVDEARGEAELLRKEAQQEARRLIDNAELESSSLMSEARSLAARIKSDSDREVAAATQRRDSINAQLANVRQMLATLTGQGPSSFDPVVPAPAAPQPAFQAAPPAAPISAAASTLVPPTQASPAAPVSYPGAYEARYENTDLGYEVGAPAAE